MSEVDVSHIRRAEKAPPLKSWRFAAQRLAWKSNVQSSRNDTTYLVIETRLPELELFEIGYHAQLHITVSIIQFLLGVAQNTALLLYSLKYALLSLQAKR
jgi:hypothetical protein